MEEIVEDPSQDGDFGAIAAAVARQPEGAHFDGVMDVRRGFGQASTDQAVVRLEEWTMTDYGRLIMPRLEAIAKRESEPKITPDVMAAWTLPDRIG